ncbi:MAG TPA: guanine deaminase [Xanthobacteraceae bacterium]|nr:guanine deaminase [Xanthobacteraceae bacterium]
MTLQILRAAALTFDRDPFLSDPAASFTYWADAAITLENGLIRSVAPFAAAAIPQTAQVASYPDSLVLPGFIDAHVHYPQTQMIAAFGEHLLAWLDRYTFVAEQQFADRTHAEEIAGVFLRELLRNGTTTAAVYCTVHPQSVEAFFAESARFNTRMIAGKVMMDRNAPAALCDTVESGVRDSLHLMERWHGRGRQLYCVTPRFAGSSSPEQLAAAGRLWREHPGVYMQTHLNESLDEIAWIASLFPEHKSYLDVYDSAGLTGPRAIFGHGVHMTEADFALCHATGSALAHCPTSNLFLGSGLFRLFEARRPDRPVRVGLGTDIGAGTSFSQLTSLNEAYKIAQLGNTRLTAAHAFWLATRGGAQALYLDDRIGALAPGYEADMVVLDLAATPLMEFRMGCCETLMDKLFVAMMLGDDRMVRATYVAGEKVYDRDRPDAPFSYPAG